MSNAVSSTVILIPAYKPTDALLTLLKTLHGMGFSVVCIDDGSGPAFDRIFEQAAQTADVLRYPLNKGKGGALKLGIRHIAESEAYRSFRAIVTADADGQHTPKDILRVAETMEKTDGLVLGVRRFTGKVPLRSRFGNSLTVGVFALASGKRLSDTQTGLRAFSIEKAPLYASIGGERYEYEMNVLFAAVENRIPITEVDIETVYENDNKGSHFHAIRDSFRIYRCIFSKKSRKDNAR
ncbi:MAG: glycosyltransferase family 2 protein [Ruminococcaceae bacterium]|nr:glycosyltransferase family 2 protein [Oscillospiraceae bacterium]